MRLLTFTYWQCLPLLPLLFSTAMAMGRPSFLKRSTMKPNNEHALEVKVEDEAAVDQVIIIPSQQSPNSATAKSNRTNALLVIFVGAMIEAKEYVPIAKRVHEQVVAVANSNMEITVGISPSTGFDTSEQILEAAFERVKEEAQTSVFGSSTKNNDSSSSSFDDVFVWGHSAGCLAAIHNAYPSSCSGFIMYGACSQAFYGIEPEDLLNHPRPSLSMIAERDGFLRYLYLVFDLAHHQQSFLSSQCKDNTKEGKMRDFIERKMNLNKAIVVVPELNHLHMSMGITPELARLSGRSDLASRIKLDEAQSKLARIVVDFMNVHCKKREDDGCNEEKLKRDVAEERILEHCAGTKEMLQPFTELSSRDFMTGFIQESQSELAPMGKEPGNIIVEWRSPEKNFIYSKPTIWQNEEQPHSALMVLQAMEQGPIAITDAVNSHRKSASNSTVLPAMIKQISKTLAIKSKSKDGVLAFLNQPNDSETVQDNPLMRLNKQTFDYVLHEVVTKEQRERYLQEGAPLTFGPDMRVANPPEWVKTPLLLTEHEKSDDAVAAAATKCDYRYVMQSPYAETSTTNPKILPPMAGVYYYKILTPAQAYEWIVFDCFK